MGRAGLKLLPSNALDRAAIASGFKVWLPATVGGKRRHDTLKSSVGCCADWARDVVRIVLNESKRVNGKSILLVAAVIA